MGWDTETDEETALREAETLISQVAAATPVATPAPPAVYVPPHVTAQHVLAVLKKHLDIRDSEGMETILATAIGIDLQGDPSWLTIVAPPGGAKSETLRAFRGPRVFSLSTLTPRTLISGLKDGGSKADLLPRLDGKLFIVKDFGSILSLPYDQQRSIYADLREAYDGYLEKGYGSGVGVKSYKARFGMIAGATDAIDRYQLIHAQLGERFLRINLRGDDASAIARACATEGGEDAMRLEIATIMQAFLDRSSEWVDPNIIMESQHLDALQALANIAARLRSPVMRDRSHMIIGTPHTEVGTRLVKQLKRLVIGLANVRGTICSTHADYFTAKRVALDTVPRYRLDIVDALLTAEILRPGQGLTSRAISILTEMPLSSATEKVEDMWVLKLVGRSGPGVGVSPYTWRLTDENRNLLHRASIDATSDMIDRLRSLNP